LLELLLRFLIGGAAVAAFSFFGDVFSPKSFAGLFGAAPSIALATLALTVSKDGKQFAAVEAHSMIGGAIAFLIYASCACSLLMKKKFSTLRTTLVLLPVWFASGYLLWLVWLR
jgi:hypothetical protein